MKVKAQESARDSRAESDGPPDSLSGPLCALGRSHRYPGDGSVCTMLDLNIAKEPKAKMHVNILSIPFTIDPLNGNQLANAPKQGHTSLLTNVLKR
jgi:hypothetical protein